MSVNPLSRFVWEPGDLKPIKKKVRSFTAITDFLFRGFKSSSGEKLISDFHSQLDEAVDRYMEGTTGKAAAKRIFLNAINEAWPSAADLGYEDGGGDASELEPGELAEIDDATASQIDYAVNFWDALPDIREEGIDPFPRIEYYVKSLRGWYNTWKLRGAKNQSLEWVLGKTEEHCKQHGDLFGCLDLAGTWHSAKWYREQGLYPGTPGSNTTCQGFNCDCYLRNKKGQKFFRDELE